MPTDIENSGSSSDLGEDGRYLLRMKGLGASPRWDDSRHLEARKCPVRGSLWLCVLLELPGLAWVQLDTSGERLVVTKCGTFPLSSGQRKNKI